MLPENVVELPYVETPEETEAPHGSGLYCFIDATRPCESECMAFLLAQPEGNDYQGQQWSKCALLVNLHKMGKHAVALAGQGDSLVRHFRVKAADDSRAKQPLPPPVR